MSKFNQTIQNIELATSSKLSNHQLIAIGGGCTNTAYKIHTASESFFIKVNQPHLLPMFEAEAYALEEMANLKSIRVPKVICYGQADSHSYLVLEYIELSSLRGNSSTLLGEQLALMHRQQQPYFGWHMDNTIGCTPQHNVRKNDWLHFWQQQRLGKQLAFAAQNGFRGRIQDGGQRLLESLHHFFSNYTPSSSLLHGDLWQGNARSDNKGNPVIFDPASYYGDRETDVAMTELFGGFSVDFYNAYQSQFPLDPGYKVRKTLYNLYHILNHVNLFGSGYLGQAESMIERLLTET